MIEGISAVTLGTHEMPRSVRFYRALGFEVLHGGEESSFTSFRAGTSYRRWRYGDEFGDADTEASLDRRSRSHNGRGLRVGGGARGSVAEGPQGGPPPSPLVVRMMPRSRGCRGCVRSDKTISRPKALFESLRSDIAGGAE
jgi:catechol 2,3-dioxygenase-like lactoylglutathione lyase family enzyme